MINEHMESIKCFICSKEFPTPRSLVSHDNRSHSGYGLKNQHTKWCSGCLSYQPKENFYKLNNGYYSYCKVCSKEKKKEWETTTTKGFNYKYSNNTPRERYNSLITWAKKNKYRIDLSKEQYFKIIEKEKCGYCAQGFQGCVDLELLQPSLGLTYGNLIRSCMLCLTKRRYNLK